MDRVVSTTPVGPDDLADLATLFGSERNTRGCWCAAFCSTRTQFALGWVTGGNRRRFEAMATDGPPMGLLARVADEPVAWCAVGPRSRYAVADGGRSSLLHDMDREEDDEVWLVACLFVRADNRGQGLTRALVGAAIDLAREQGSSALEGWPTADGSNPVAAEGFVGRQSVFASWDFTCVAQPRPDRVIMRLTLGDPSASAP